MRAAKADKLKHDKTEAIAQHLADDPRYWYRQKYHLTSNDPRYLEIPFDEIMLEWRADQIIKSRENGKPLPTDTTYQLKIQQVLDKLQLLQEETHAPTPPQSSKRTE